MRDCKEDTTNHYINKIHPSESLHCMRWITRLMIIVKAYLRYCLLNVATESTFQNRSNENQYIQLAHEIRNLEQKQRVSELEQNSQIL